MTQTFDRFNKLVGELANAGTIIDKDDVNIKFLRSLNDDWTMYTISYRKGSQLEKIALEDVYNDLRTFETEVEGKKSSSYIQNAALVTPISEAPTNEALFGEKSHGSSSSPSTHQDINVNIVLESFYVSHINSPLINDDLEQVSPDYLEEMDIKWQLAMITMRAK